MPVVGIGGRDHAGDIAVGDQPDAAAERAQLGDDGLVPGTVEHAGGDVGGLDALRLGDRADVVGDRAREVDRPFGIARADRELLHVDVGRVEQAAALRDREDRKRVRAGLGGDRRALERVERDVDRRSAILRRADALADVEHRRLVALALADDHGAVHRQLVERGAHRLDGGSVGGLLVAAADQPRGGDRRGFGDSHHLEDEDAVEDVAAGMSRGSRSS